jgi:hypothetical protein
MKPDGAASPPNADAIPVPKIVGQLAQPDGL